MDRRVLALAALLAVVALAGCGDPRVTVEPRVESITPADGGRYQVTVTAAGDFPEHDVTVSDVRVHGYTMSGEHVCTAEYGDLSEYRTTTVTCSSFPAILVSDTASRGERISADREYGMNRTVVSTAVLYRGREGGTHRFEQFTDDLTEHFEFRQGRPVPTAVALRQLRCRQWRASKRGASFAALGDPHWVQFDLQSLNTTRVYRVRVRDYAAINTAEESDEGDIDPDAYVYGPEQAPPALAALLDPDEREFWTTRTVSRDNFTAMVAGLTGAGTGKNNSDPVTLLSDLRAPVETAGPEVSCRASPATIEDVRRHEATVFVRQDDIRWSVEFTVIERYTGDGLFGTVTGSGS